MGNTAAVPPPSAGDQGRREFVSRMMGQMEPRGEDEDLREAVVELLTRRFLAEAGGGLVQRVLLVTRN
jgi:hypothetical protein